MQNLVEPTARPEMEKAACPLCGSLNDCIIHSFGEFQVSLCRACGLRYLNPRIKESLMQDRYTNGTYFTGEDISGYDDYYSQEVSLRLTFRRFLGNIRKIVPRADSLLEVGCGYGFFLDEAKGFFSRRSGIELSAEAGSRAQKTSGAPVHIGSIYTLPPEMKDFDLIVMINVIEHVYEPVRMLLSLSERLTPEGMMVLATPDIGSFWYKIMRKRWPSFKIPEHVAFYDKKTLKDLFNRTGLQPAGTIPFHHAFPLAIIAEKFGVKLPPGLAGKIVWLPRVMIAVAGTKQTSFDSSSVDRG